MARTFCQEDVAFNRGATTALIGAGTGIAASGALMADPSLLGIGVIQAVIGLGMAGYTAMVAKIVRRRQAIPLANRERPAVPPKP
jgi:hypothetical protein